MPRPLSLVLVVFTHAISLIACGIACVAQEIEPIPRGELRSYTFDQSKV
jgi:hypothetical protein